MFRIFVSPRNWGFKCTSYLSLPAHSSVNQQNGEVQACMNSLVHGIMFVNKPIDIPQEKLVEVLEQPTEAQLHLMADELLTGAKPNLLVQKKPNSKKRGAQA